MEELNNRQIYSKKDNDYDEWNVAQNKFSNYNFNKPNDDMDVREEINYEQEDNKFLDVKPRKVYKEGNAKHNEFELDWDEDESYSYLKMLNNENTKENINKYGVQNQLLIKQSKQVFKCLSLYLIFLRRIMHTILRHHHKNRERKSVEKMKQREKNWRKTIKLKEQEKGTSNQLLLKLMIGMNNNLFK